MATWDDQSQATKDLFESVWGSNARKQWETEHQSEIAKASSGVGQGSGSSNPFGNFTAEDILQYHREMAGSQERLAGLNNKNAKSIAKMQVGASTANAKTAADAAIRAAEIRAGTDREDIAARLRINMDNLAWDREKFPQLLAQEAEKIALERRQLEEIGIPAQKLAEWEAQKKYELAVAAHQLETETARVNAIQQQQRIDIERQTMLGNQQAQRGQLGASLFNTLANLNNAGAAKAFQYAAAADEARNNPDAQSWLQSLYAMTRNGSSLPNMGDVSPVSGNTLWGQLGIDANPSGFGMGTGETAYAGGSPTYNETTGTYTTGADSNAGGVSADVRNAILQGMQGVYRAPNKLAPQYLAMRTPTQTGLLQSGAEASGYNWEDVLAQARRAGIGQ